jgi:hypothetical protein
LALCHVGESSEILGVEISAFLVTTPSDVSLSGVFEEFLSNGFHVFHLGIHLTHDGFANFVGHLLHGSVGFLSLFEGFSQFVSSDTSVKVKITFGVSGTLTHKSFGWWSRSEGSVLLIGKAFSEFMFLAIRTWLNPLGEIFKSFGSIMDNSSLMSSNIINSLFSSSVEVLSNFFSIFGMGLSFELSHVKFHLFHSFSPFSSGRKFSVVRIWSINLDTELTWTFVSPIDPSAVSSFHFLPSFLVAIFWSSHSTMVINMDINASLVHGRSCAFVFEVFSDCVMHSPFLMSHLIKYSTISHLFLLSWASLLTCGLVILTSIFSVQRFHSFPPMSLEAIHLSLNSSA